MLTAIETSRLVDRIYAAGETGVWDECLEMLCAALDSTGTHLLHFANLGEAPTVLGTVRTDAVARQEYGAYYHRIDPRQNRMPAQTMPIGLVLPGTAVLSHAEMQRTEYYADFARRYDLTRALFGVTGNPATGSRLALSINRGDSQPEFDGRAVEFVASLLPHFARAIEVRTRWAALDQRQQASLEVLDVLPFAVFLVDGDCRVCLANARASKLLATGDGIAADGAGYAAWMGRPRGSCARSARGSRPPAGKCRGTPAPFSISRARPAPLPCRR